MAILLLFQSYKTFTMDIVYITGQALSNTENKTVFHNIPNYGIYFMGVWNILLFSWISVDDQLVHFEIEKIRCSLLSITPLFSSGKLKFRRL